MLLWKSEIKIPRSFLPPALRSERGLCFHRRVSLILFNWWGGGGGWSCPREEGVDHQPPPPQVGQGHWPHHLLPGWARSLTSPSPPGWARSLTSPPPPPPPPRMGQVIDLTTSPPRQQSYGNYGQWAGGTHPTGMQSCWSNCHILHFNILTDKLEFVMSNRWLHLLWRIE